MKLEDVTEKIVRIIKKVESCRWSDRSGTCSKDCPLWNSTEPGECCDSLKYLKNEKIEEFSERITNIFREEYPEEMKEQSDDVDDVVEKTVRIIRKIEQCNWTKDNGWECSTECPVWNIEGCSDGIRYMSEDDFQKYIEAIVRQFHKEYSEGLDKSMDEMDAVEDKKEIVIDDVVEYLRGMTEKWHTLCRTAGIPCSDCKINNKGPEDLCLFMRRLEVRIEEGIFEKVDKILESGTIEVYPDPKATISSFIQTKIDAAESESEKNEYQEIVNYLDLWRSELGKAQAD